MTQHSRGTPHYALVDHLTRLAETSNTLPAARAALAELRRGLTDPVRSARHVARWVPEAKTNRERSTEDRYYLVAALFAWHREHQSAMSIGKAFSAIRDDSDSVEGRFFALLATPADALPARLGQAVRMLASKNIALDWHLLLDDVLHWDDAGKPRQRRLAREYYRQKPEESSPNPDDDRTNTEENEAQP